MKLSAEVDVAAVVLLAFAWGRTAMFAVGGILLIVALMGLVVAQERTAKSSINTTSPPPEATSQ